MSIEAKIDFEDNTPKTLEEEKRKLLLALKMIGQQAEGHAKDNAPVDTGRLRNSITNEVVADEKAVYIGSNVEYAPYQEYGTVKMSAANGGIGYLRPAINENLDEYKNTVEKVMNSN